MIYALILLFIDLAFSAVLNENLLRNRIEEFERRGYVGKTVSLYEDLLQYHPTDPELAHGLARALKAEEDYVELIRHLKKWVESNSNDELAIFMLGEGYLELGEIKKAIRTWDSLIKSQHVSLGTYRKLSNSCESVGLFREAIGFLEKGRKANGSKKLFVWELAKLRMRVGDIEEAVAVELEHRRSGLIGLNRRVGNKGSLSHRVDNRGANAVGPGLVLAKIHIHSRCEAPAKA